MRLTCIGITCFTNYHNFLLQVRSSCFSRWAASLYLPHKHCFHTRIESSISTVYQLTEAELSFPLYACFTYWDSLIDGNDPCLDLNGLEFLEISLYANTGTIQKQFCLILWIQSSHHLFLWEIKQQSIIFIKSWIVLGLVDTASLFSLCLHSICMELYPHPPPSAWHIGCIASSTLRNTPSEEKDSKSTTLNLYLKYRNTVLLYCNAIDKVDGIQSVHC